jgi:hypothetical protein
MKWLSVVMFAGLTAACGGGSSTSSTSATTPPAATPPAAEAAKAPEPPAEKEMTVPTGTAIRLDLASALSTETAKVEDPVKATVRQAIVIDGATVIPVGSELRGTVTAVDRPGRVKGLAKIAYRFDKLRMAGETYSIRTSPIGHEGESSKKQDATKIGVGAGAGAVIGGILGGGSGAAKGAAIGGGAGTGVVLATRGKELTLAPGVSITTKLTAPLTIKVKA